MYYLTVLKGKDKDEVVASKSFDDFGNAMDACAEFYSPKTPRAVLSFTTEAINGKFARAYTELNQLGDIDAESADGSERHHYAAKHSKTHEYENSFFFLIESELGIKDAKNT